MSLFFSFLSTDAYAMTIIIIIIPRMIFEGLLTSKRSATDNYPDYDGSRECANRLRTHARTCGLCVGNTTHPILSKLKATPTMVLTIGL